MYFSARNIFIKFLIRQAMFFIWLKITFKLTNAEIFVCYRIVHSIYLLRPGKSVILTYEEQKKAYQLIDLIPQTANKRVKPAQLLNQEMWVNQQNLRKKIVTENKFNCCHCVARCTKIIQHNIKLWRVFTENTILGKCQLNVIFTSSRVKG